MSTFGTADWLDLLAEYPALPPCAKATIVALSATPNGPHDPQVLWQRTGLSAEATAWMLDALERMHVITRDDRPHLYLPMPF